LFTINQINNHLSVVILNLDLFSRLFPEKTKRDIELLGSHFLFKKHFKDENIEICYDTNRKPYLKNRSEFISISHSHARLVVCVNKKENTGVDIELIRDKVLKIKHKFVNDSEALAAKDDVEKLITIWAAKEALYKCYGLKNLDFKTNLKVEGFENDVFYGIIETTGFKKTLLLKKEKINDYLLVYILKDQAN